MIKFNIHIREKALAILSKIGLSSEVDIFLKKIKKDLPKNLNYVSPMIIKQQINKDSRDT